MNIAICDDLENDRHALIHMIEKYCKDYNLEVKLFTYKNGKELLSNFTSGKFKRTRHWNFLCSCGCLQIWWQCKI
ncbi:hypothetical protein psyc5s11_50450 [Clostridium gelidum]|uniref:Stage 0 sporulation protein A homolog n=1 Tax=Clostridium gelidum TaxID=704125 RepID=A0ABN6J5F5_9CLOT|nr:hypothetical protein [Clostridium gelidum]BCZ48978.1 hypothetical protein psyc5s11_50450 [Clostridium gelidum]